MHELHCRQNRLKEHVTRPACILHFKVQNVYLSTSNKQDLMYIYSLLSRPYTEQHSCRRLLPQHATELLIIHEATSATAVE